MSAPDPFVAGIQALATALSRQAAADQGIATLGVLREMLYQMPEGMPVLIAAPEGHDEEYPQGWSEPRRPTRINSYRGYYERLAIGFEPVATGRHNVEAVDSRAVHSNLYDGGTYCAEVLVGERGTAHDLARALDLCDGEVFEGYKGGEFTMDDRTYLHVAEYGQTGFGVHTAAIVDGEHGATLILSTIVEEF